MVLTPTHTIQVGGITNMVKALEQHVGWRYAYLVLSGLCVATALLAFLVFRDKPETYGLLPDGDGWLPHAGVAATTTRGGTNHAAANAPFVDVYGHDAAAAAEDSPRRRRQYRLMMQEQRRRKRANKKRKQRKKRRKGRGHEFEQEQGQEQQQEQGQEQAKEEKGEGQGKGRERASQRRRHAVVSLGEDRQIDARAPAPHAHPHSHPPRHGRLSSSSRSSSAGGTPQPGAGGTRRRGGTHGGGTHGGTPHAGAGLLPPRSSSHTSSSLSLSGEVEVVEHDGWTHRGLARVPSAASSMTGPAHDVSLSRHGHSRFGSGLSHMMQVDYHSGASHHSLLEYARHSSLASMSATAPSPTHAPAAPSTATATAAATATAMDAAHVGAISVGTTSPVSPPSPAMELAHVPSEPTHAHGADQHDDATRLLHNHTHRHHSPPHSCSATAGTVPRVEVGSTGLVHRSQKPLPHQQHQQHQKKRPSLHTTHGSHRSLRGAAQRRGGGGAGAHAGAASGSGGDKRPAEEWTAKEALATPAFWAYSLGALAIALTLTGMYINLERILKVRTFLAGARARADGNALVCV